MNTVERIRELAAEGLGFAAIGKRVGRSSGYVRGVVDALGVTISRERRRLKVHRGGRGNSTTPAVI